MVLIGKYVNTHGIKGEIRIKSNFKYKDKVFKRGNKLIIKNKEFIIETYRVHKEYDMVTFKNITDINQIIDLKNELVYFNDLKLDKGEYLDSDLYGFKVFMNNKEIGSLTDIIYMTEKKKLLVVNSKYIPFELIENIDFLNKKINIEEVYGLI